MKFKRLIPALAMLLVSAILLGTSTFAWFSMNTQVTATGMQVKAVAEDGLLIKNELDTDAVTNWKVSTTASYGTLVDLAPTSTTDVTAWYHAKSDNQNDAKANQDAANYETLSANANWKREEGTGKSGAYFIDSATNVGTKDASEKAYVLLNKFYIKSSGNAIALGGTNTYQDLYINKVNVGATSTSAALDASLRVAIKVGSTLTIYAPVSGATTSYKVAGATDVTATTVPSGGLVNTATSTASIPAVTATEGWVEADVYIYFEGEDANLKSANLTESLDTLTVEVIFGITQLS